MSGAVSYELFSAKFGDSGFTSLGGYYETFINDTGADSIKGTIVVASLSTYDAVDIAPGSSQMAVGVIYEDGVANGLPVKVVVSGKAEVLLRSGQNSHFGYWCGVSDVAGRMYQLSSPPGLLINISTGIGQSLDEQSSDLSLVQLQFS